MFFRKKKEEVEEVEIDPPSYDHAFQSNANPQNEVQRYGLYSDATYDSFQRGEMFIQAFRADIDRLHPNEAHEVKQSGIKNIQWDDRTQYNGLYRHPMSMNDQHPAYCMNGNIIQFWPTVSPFGSLVDHDTTIQATHPFLTLSEYNNVIIDNLEHYFEITVLDRPSSVVVAIGLSTKPYPLFRMPGWNKFSVGYHSDDGHKFCDDATGGQSYGPSWDGIGDTVGCGYCPDNGSVYFTKNGVMIGYAYSGLSRHVYYASIGADGPCRIKVNMGKEPFVYHVTQWMGQYV